MVKVEGKKTGIQLAREVYEIRMTGRNGRGEVGLEAKKGTMI